PSTRGVQRKTPGETECIHYAPSWTQFLDRSTIFTLVEEEPGFLAAQNFRLEAQTRFQKKDWPIQSSTVQNFSIFSRESFVGGCLQVTTQAQYDPLRIELF